MAKKRRDDTSLSSLLGRKREINIDEIEKATQQVHESKKETPPAAITKTPVSKKKPETIKVQKPKKKTTQAKVPKKEKSEAEDVVMASIATPYELYMKAKRLQRKQGYRSLGAFFLNCVEDYLKKPLSTAPAPLDVDFSDSIDVSVSPDLELWMQIKLNQRRLGFRNMANFYVFCLDRYLKKYE